MNIAARFVLFALSFALVAASHTEAQVVAIQGILDGNLTIVSLRRDMQAIQLKAGDSKFIPENVREGVIKPRFGVANEQKLFKLQPQGFRHVYFGNVLQPIRFAPFEIKGVLKADGRGRNEIDADGFVVIATPAGPGTLLSMSDGLHSAFHALNITANAIIQHVFASY